MRRHKLMLVVLLPLSVLLLGLLWLQHSARAAPSDGSPVASGGVWPPFHENLSDSTERDSGDADIDANGDNVVVVWAEGLGASSLNDGLVKLAWKRGADDAWQALTVPLEREGYAHYHPAVALGGQTAHVVWVREDIEGGGKGNNQISYAHCDLDLGACVDPIRITTDDPTFSRLAPDIAVDPFGVPHVVWVQQDSSQVSIIWYTNRVGDSWGGSPEQVSGGSDLCTYSQDNPAVAVDASHVYVAWDENVRDCGGGGGTAGIYFRRRGNVTGAAGSGADWEPDGTPWGKQLSKAHPGIPANPSDIDGFPTIDVGEGWTYVMWERFVYSETMPLYDAVYTYSLPYRVHTGALPEDDWWPGGASADRWAVMPFTSTSATDRGEYYEGVRPSLKMVGKEPHVVWHQWYAPSLSALADERSLEGTSLNPLEQLTDERLVDSQHPYKVSYATYREGTDPNDLEGAQASWVSKTLQVLGSDRILAWADLALASTDGGSTYDLHVALHQRGGFVSGADSYAWDVWYTNGAISFREYLPVVFRNHR